MFEWEATELVAHSHFFRRLQENDSDMPREIRKRGKKKKGQAEEEVDYPNQKADPIVFEEEAEPHAFNEPTAGPSWMRSAPTQTGPSGSGGVDSEAPFGYVEADVKAYFRTVDLKLREWQEGTEEDDVPEGIDPNEGQWHAVICGSDIVAKNPCLKNAELSSWLL